MRVARLDDIPRLPGLAEDLPSWTPIRHTLGVEAFGVNAWHADAGALAIEPHDEADEPGEPGHEEVYLVLRGHARFTIDGDDVDAPAGTLISVPPNTPRQGLATEDGTTVLALGAARGVVYEPSAWELREIAKAAEPSSPK